MRTEMDRNSTSFCASGQAEGLDAIRLTTRGARRLRDLCAPQAKISGPAHKIPSALCGRKALLQRRFEEEGCEPKWTGIRRRFVRPAKRKGSTPYDLQLGERADCAICVRRRRKFPAQRTKFPARSVAVKLCCNDGSKKKDANRNGPEFDVVLCVRPSGRARRHTTYNSGSAQIARFVCAAGENFRPSAQNS